MSELKTGKISKESGNVITPMFRASYANLFRPRLNRLNVAKGEEYSVLALFPKDADLTVLREAAMTALRAKFGVKMDDPRFRKELRSPFRDDKEYEGLEEGAIFVRFAAKKEYPPQIVGSRGEALAEHDAYSGMWARASVQAFAYDNASKGVAFGLRNVQKIKDGEPLGGGRVDPAADFSPVDDAPAKAAAGGKGAAAFLD